MKDKDVWKRLQGRSEGLISGARSYSVQPPYQKLATAALAANHLNNHESSRGIIACLLKAGAGRLSGEYDINVEVCY
jgi:hypothetical protein